MIWHDGKSESLADGRKHQHYFHHREGVADAEARPAAEREVGALLGRLA